MNTTEGFKPLPNFVSYDEESFKVYSQSKSDESVNAYLIRVSYSLEDNSGRKLGNYNWSLLI